MWLVAQIRKIFDMDVAAASDSTGGKLPNLLVSKGDHLHEMLMYLIGIFSVVYSLVNLVLWDLQELFITFLPLPFVMVSFFLYRRGHTLASKILNLFSCTSTIALLSLQNTPVTGVLTFLIPIFISALLAFQGKERKYGYFFSLYTIALMLFLLLTDLRIGNRVLTPEHIRTEWVMNLTGASIATLLEIFFILELSNTIQGRLLEKTAELSNQNTKLESLLEKSRKDSNQIEQQLEQIKASEVQLSRLSLIATHTRSGVIITNENGEVEWVNASFERITHRTLKEVKGRQLTEMLSEVLRLGFSLDDQIEKVKQTGENVILTVQNLGIEGDVFYDQLELLPVYGNNGTIVNFLTLIRDITTEKTFQDQLLRINTRFDLITTKSNIGIWEWEVETNEVTWNEVLVRQYGATRKTMPQDYFQFWKDSIILDNRSHMEEEIGKLMAGERDVVEEDFQITRLDTGEIRSIRSLSIAERDEKGQLKRLMGSSLDLTEEKALQRTLRDRNDQLQKANAELDNFVYSVSHDLRSPLLSVKGLLSLIFDTAQVDENVEKYLRMAEKSINRLDDTIREILEYSRNARLGVQREPVNLQTMIAQIFQDLRYSTEASFQFLDHYEGSPIVFTDKARINTVLRNVIGNAVKYRKSQVEASFVSVSLFRKGGALQLNVIDNGEGIESADIQRVFDMFYRGTSTGVGTGLGLYISREVMAKLGGTITLRSELGKGTEVCILLPEAEPSAAE